MLLSKGVIAQYRLNESSGLVAADSVGDNDGTLVKMDNSNWITGKRGNCLSFDGVEEVVTTVDFQTLFRGSFSISFCVKATTWPASTEYFIGYRRSVGGQDHEAYVATLSSGKVRFKCECGDDGIDASRTSAVVQTNAQWSHIVATVNAVTGYQGLYHDGILVAYHDTALLGGMSSFATEGTTMCIGAYCGDVNPAGWFVGSIDNPILYNRALTIDEIKALYNNGNGREILIDNKSFFHNINMTNCWGF